MVTRWFARFALCGFLLAAPAQDLRSLKHQSWSTQEGLPQNSVHAILQTRDGFLWIATEGGLARFDGASFRAFSHENQPAFTSDDLSSLAQTSDGALWIGTADGLLRYRDGSFHRFDERSGLPSASIAGLSLSEDGSLLVLTASGTASQSRDGFLASSSFRSASSWTMSGQAVHFLSREWRISRELPGSRLESLTADRNNHQAWAGTNAGLFVLERDSPTAIPIAALAGTTVLCVTQDAEGNYWVGTETSGLHLLRALKFRSEPALADKALTAVIQTTDGALWAGTRDDGLRRIRNGVADEPVPSRSLTSPIILSLAPGPNGSLWAGTPDGLNQISSVGTVRRITAAEGLPDEDIRSLAAAPDGSVWAGTRRGLAHVFALNIETVTTANGLPSNLIGTLLLTTDGTLWIATSAGLSALASGKSLHTYTQADGLSSPIVTAITQNSAGVLYAAYKGGGLSRFDGHRFAPILPEVHEEIEAILPDNQGYLWLRHTRGISRTDGSNLTRFGLADGLPSDELVPGGSPAAWLTAAGEAWFPTRRGIAIADTAHLPLNLVPPPVAVEGLQVDDTVLSQSNVEIPYGHNRFSFDYAGLSFTVPSEVRYSVLLEGFDRDWTDTGLHRTATYTNLPPGHYNFRVRAANNDGVRNTTGASFAFRIVPPFYRRWWFYALVVLLFAALVAALYLLRLRRLRQQFNAVLAERNRMAREIHDTLAQDFVGVSIQLEIVQQLLSLQKPEAAASQVQQTRKLVRDGLAEARQSIWELRANTAQDSLPTRLAKLVERYTSTHLAAKLNITGAFRPLESRIEAELLRISGEALTNVQRHARASQATIELRYERAMLVLTVADNGCGFRSSDPRPDGHFGIGGMQERAELIQAQLTLQSEPGIGTRVTLSVPIPER